MQQRSTKGASKQRREMINSEIIRIRDLLPVAENIRSRLSQLQVMSLCNAYIGKCNFFENTIPTGDATFRKVAQVFQLSEFSELLPGFLMVMTLEGKVLYLSENVLEYLGHSMVDILTHVDTIYDLVESADRKLVKEVLDGLKSSGAVHSLDEWSFVCRMGLTKKLHQNLGLSDQKLMQVRGWFRAAPFHSEFQQPVFMALCTPRLNAGLATDHNILSDTMVYETLHGPDMKYLDISRSGEAHLGYTREEIKSRSWYEFIHPDDLHRAVSAHKNLMYCESESKSPLLVRMQTRDGRLIWVCIFLSKIRSTDGDDRYVCINQVITDQEAMQERPTGLWRDRLLSSSCEMALGSPNESEFSMSSGNDSPLSKCTGREEVLRRLKRKMAMKEFQRKRSLLSSGTTPDPRSCTAPAASQGKGCGVAEIFTFDAASIEKATMQSISSKPKPIVNVERKTTKATRNDNRFECDNSSSSFSSATSASLSSSSSSSSSLCGNSVFPTVSPLLNVSPFLTSSPIPPHSSQFPNVSTFPVVSKLPTASSSFPALSPFPGVQSTLPMPYGPKTMCIQDEGTAFITSMPTPKFEELSPSSSESYRTGASDEEEEEVVNIVEEMMDGKPFVGDVATGKSQNSAARQKRAYDLPELGPGAVDAFFQEVVGSANRLDAAVEFEELNASSFASFERNCSLSAGQTSVQLSGMYWGSARAAEVAESVAEGIWSEQDRHGVLSSAVKDSWFDGSCGNTTSEYSFDYNELLHLANDLPWNGPSSFMTVDYGHGY